MQRWTPNEGAAATLRPRIVVSAAQSAADWQRAAPADELLPYYRIWSERPVLQAVFFIREIADLVHELGRLRDAERVRGLFLDLPADEADQPLAVDAVVGPSYLDRSRALFRVFEDDGPTAYAIDAGLRIALPLDEPISGNLRDVELQPLGAKCVSFVRGLRPRGREWAYPIRPHEPPSLFGTFAAVSSFDHATYRALDPMPADGLSGEIERVAKGLPSGEFQYRSAEFFAFTRRVGGEGCLSTTEQTYRVAGMVHRLLGDGTEELDHLLRQEARHVLAFIRACWRRDVGGFAMSPAADAVPNLTHSRAALQLLRTLLSRRDITTADLDWLDVGAVIGFVASCWSDHGFAAIPGSQPAICPLRDALSIAKLLMLFALYGIEPAARELDRLRALLDTATAIAHPFSQACIDPEREEAYAYPIAVIRAWRKEEATHPDGRVAADPRREEKNAMPPPDGWEAAEREFDAAVAYFDEHRAWFTERYAGRYVAIRNGEVLDSDSDRLRLSERTFMKYRNLPLYMPFVSVPGVEEPRPSVWMPRAIRR